MTLPEDFTTYTQQLMGENLFLTLLQGLEDEAPTSIRLNPFKGAKASSAWRPVPWCPYGYYLPNRPNFTFDPLLHAGMYYVQEASSMFLDHLLRQLVKEPVLMLDLCAAPGGKSTCAMSALPEGSLLFSNEPMKTRAQILSENIQKFGHPRITVTNNYPMDYRKSGLLFDVILTDVPCSGEGMFRKDEGSIREWSLHNVEKCQQLQREIVTDCWSCLRPGGLLIYSTCTFNAHEDEENVEWIAHALGATAVEIPVEGSWNVTGPLVGSHPAYRFIPGKTKGEGLFMAVLRKNGEGKPLATDEKALAKLTAQYQKEASKRLHVLCAGVKAGIQKGKDMIPDESLALSITLDPSQYPMADINYDQAISYLRKESIVLSPDIPRGIVLLTYHHIPLGFAKNIGNRANNLYPAEWKIKSSHIPEGDNHVLDI